MTLNAQKSSLKINSVNKKKFCQNCKKYGHRTKDCDDFDDSEQNENDASQKDAHTSKRMHCDFCDKDGHTESHCHFKKRFNAKLKQIQEEEAAAESDGSSTTQGGDDESSKKEKDKPVNTARSHISDKSITDLCQRLKSGEIKLAL